MSVEFIDIQNYVERIATIFENDSTLFPENTVGESLVNGVLRNKPPMVQSSQDSITPYIVVFESSQPIRDIEKAGRDTIDAEGGGVYEVEIYCVAVSSSELSAELAQQKLHTITAAMRNALANNLRLIDPDSSDDPICRTHTRFQIAYNLSGEVPSSMKAFNVVVRAQVYVSPATEV